jgi:hypothetical protein
MTIKRKTALKKRIWKRTGLRAGDKAGVIELIQRDVRMSDLNDYFDMVDPKQQLMEEEFVEIVGKKLEKWNKKDLLKFWEKHHYK